MHGRDGWRTRFASAVSCGFRRSSPSNWRGGNRSSSSTATQVFLAAIWSRFQSRFAWRERQRSLPLDAVDDICRAHRRNPRSVSVARHFGTPTRFASSQASSSGAGVDCRQRLRWHSPPGSAPQGVARLSEGWSGQRGSDFDCRRQRYWRFRATATSRIRTIRSGRTSSSMATVVSVRRRIVATIRRVGCGLRQRYSYRDLARVRSHAQSPVWHGKMPRLSTRRPSATRSIERHV